MRALAGRDDGWRGLLPGLLPLLLLLCITGITFITVTLVRQSLSAVDFATQQQAELTVVGAGLLLALIVYGGANWIVLRRLSVWRAQGLQQRVNIVLWTLSASALIVLLPVIAAFLLPQHPAP